MKIADIISFLEAQAHPLLQEPYDNAGLITGDANWECSGIICTLDAIEEVVTEAIGKKVNLIIAHHPIIFSGLKKLNGKNYVEKTIITAIKNDIAIYAIHTNLDNVAHGVNAKMAAMLGLQNTSVLAPKEGMLKKLFTFVPVEQAEEVRSAIFEAGGGEIGRYNECSFNSNGSGTFKAGKGATPFVGKIGERHIENEVKVEIIFPSYLERKVLTAMKESHPYEEVAYDVVNLSNSHPGIGAGMVGELAEVMSESALLDHIKSVFQVPLVRHTALLAKPVKRIALCGGSGSFLISKALAANADAYITADIKYHEFFEANNRMLIADIGHYESEQFTINLLQELLAEKFPTFAVLKTAIKTNPVHYH